MSSFFTHLLAGVGMLTLRWALIKIANRYQPPAREPWEPDEDEEDYVRGF